MVLEAAVTGRVNVLVTFNLRDFTPERFGISVLRPQEALRTVR